MTVATVIVLALILAAELVNGWTDAPNAIATVVGTRSLRPGPALAVATLFNMLGVLSGTAVATTIGTGIVDPSAISITTVGAAMVGLIFWSTLAARFGIPTSESHALVAGLAGAGLAASGPSVLLWSGWQKVLLGLLLSSVIGFIGGWVLVVLISWAFRRADRMKARHVFRWLQIGSSAFVAFSHGSNDGQKFMGAFTLTLVLAGVLHAFTIPYWVILLCGGIMALGTMIGGWRIMQTLGTKLTRLETHQGFAAETAAAATITFASSFGIPLSTTHTISTAIMGVGITRGVRNVKWRIARELAVAWLLTFPICGAISWLVVLAMRAVPSQVKVAVFVLIVLGTATHLVRTRIDASAIGNGTRPSLGG